MNTKAIFLDVDGTLVAGHMEMSDKVKEAITKARLNGHKVFICTGRNKAGIKKELESVEFDGIVASAGSYVEINNKVIHSTYFDKSLVDKITNIFNTNNIFYNYECTDMTFMSDEMVQLFVGGVNFDKDNFELERLRAQQHDKFNIKDMSCYTNQKIHKICFISLDQEVLNQAVRMLEQDVNVIIHDMFDVTTINGELISKTNNKATGIQYAIDYLNIDKENTIAFGDSMNDYEMIDFVNYGVVMENGSAQLKQIASSVCKSVDEDGVYHEFINLGLI
ncbi:HAD family hydrolase [Thomasclavelia cocleata]|uniref:HAD family hydrolase n=1 Tax=Thomasclavelia cocleata TaxID=69824 RepID=UPI003513FACB